MQARRLAVIKSGTGIAQDRNMVHEILSIQFAASIIYSFPDPKPTGINSEVNKWFGPKKTVLMRHLTQLIFSFYSKILYVP